jgi:hypothetical protein
MSRILKSLVAGGFAAGLALAVSSSATASMFECNDTSNFCLDAAKGAAWEADARSTSKDRSKRKKGSETLSISIEGGRGSVFVNGRYAGTAPLDGISVPSGKNDIQVRDGAEVLTQGLLTVPRGANLSATVAHP